MTESRWNAVVPSIREFQSHLASHIPELRIQHVNDRCWSQERYLEQRGAGVFDLFGVYLIFDASESLEYVGLAMNDFASRIWSHDSSVDRMFTDIIPIPHEYYFLAPALEFFLICRLHPPKNTIYTGYSIPEARAKSPDGDRQSRPSS